MSSTAPGQRRRTVHEANTSGPTRVNPSNPNNWGVRVALPEWYRGLVAPSLEGARAAWYRDGETALKALSSAEVLWHELWGPGQPALDDLVAAAPQLNWMH